MLRRLLQRVLYTLPVIWLVVSLVFLLIHLVPGDPIAQMLGEGAPAADIAATRHAYGLDAPLGDQYIRYWKGVLHGDLGRSIRYNQTVTRLMPPDLECQWIQGTGPAARPRGSIEAGLRNVAYALLSGA